MIDKWLKAGAVENGLLHRTTEGSPQGGVISPCLSNVFLHHVLDEWFESQVRPRLKGASTLVRFADDAVMAFDSIVDAKRVLAVLDKRFERYGLTLHTDKTRLIDFRPQKTEGTRHPETAGTMFDFRTLGAKRKGTRVRAPTSSRSARGARNGARRTNTCRRDFLLQADADTLYSEGYVHAMSAAAGQRTDAGFLLRALHIRLPRSTCSIRAFDGCPRRSTLAWTIGWFRTHTKSSWMTRSAAIS